MNISNAAICFKFITVKYQKRDQSWPCKLQQMIADVTDVTDADN